MTQKTRVLETLREALLKYIADGNSIYGLAADTRVNAAVITRFKNSDKGITIQTAEMLIPVVMPGHSLRISMDGPKELFAGQKFASMEEFLAYVAGVIADRTGENLTAIDKKLAALITEAEAADDR